MPTEVALTTTAQSAHIARRPNGPDRTRKGGRVASPVRMNDSPRSPQRHRAREMASTIARAAATATEHANALAGELHSVGRRATTRNPHRRY